MWGYDAGRGLGWATGGRRGLDFAARLCSAGAGVRAFGSGIFFVSNNHDGTLRIEDSVITGNTGGEWNVLPGISMHEDTEQVMTNATIE